MKQEVEDINKDNGYFFDCMAATRAIKFWPVFLRQSWINSPLAEKVHIVLLMLILNSCLSRSTKAISSITQPRCISITSSVSSYFIGKVKIAHHPKALLVNPIFIKLNEKRKFYSLSVKPPATSMAYAWPLCSVVLWILYRTKEVSPWVSLGACLHRRRQSYWMRVRSWLLVNKRRIPISRLYCCG